jgi:hypothetical protein
VGLFAVSTGVAIAYAIVLWMVLIVVPAAVTALKGQWARHRYGPNKLAQARARYGVVASD